jgi:hypothetical protein
LPDYWLKRVAEDINIKIHNKIEVYLLLVNTFYTTGVSNFMLIISGNIKGIWVAPTRVCMVGF